MKYVNGGVLCVTSILLFSGMAEAKDKNLYDGNTYVINESGYCAVIYSKGGGNLSGDFKGGENLSRIYIKDDSGETVKGKHPVYVDIDFYVPDSKDGKIGNNPCRGNSYMKGKKHLKLDGPWATITSTVQY
ncbi:hypothetical protein [Dickeya dianthicola]|uniref:hypothetical protein n=1 Tax=Dickeya dianthicola TaxID=204039 RepID=UPI0003A23020|nr:hypothetical protein [Dickeya dianthicola]ATO32730.1 hypothetical protein DDI_1562 [Dickeya dianthicola RNS04.9]MBT1431833.1 hypothetical protein [Dickeya dianthicola]MCA7004764.1 hypothetical protein [Dickeya dianthicola]MCI4154476.1 hypothetical protein [Dickeya dianthicola]MCI4204069.1 hypothetical protein [Dickeya dianthicola]